MTVVDNVIMFEGFIAWDMNEGFEKIRIVDAKTNYKVDLISRIKEAIYSFCNSYVSFRYYTSDEVCTLDKMKEGLILSTVGGISADLSSYSYDLSEMTTGIVDYNTTLEIGGHNIFKELTAKVGKYCIIIIEFKVKV